MTTAALPDAAVETYSARTLPWQQLLKAALRARAAGRAPERTGASMARNLSGCLLRLLLVAMVLFLALVAALFLFGSALLRGNAPY